MEQKQTAVEWLESKMPTAFKELTINKGLFQQAKEMEKKQKIQFGYRCIVEVDAELGDLIYQKLPEEIYKEEYGGNNEQQ